MPTWKKVVVSGSAISQLANDANYLAAGGTFSSSVDSRLDSLEGGGGTSGLSQSAHTQRTALISSLSSSVDTHLDANISALSSSVDTHLDANIAALSGAAHTQREAIKGLATTANNTLSSSIATALRAERVAGDNALSGAAHTQREAIKGLATTANNSLSSSIATALRAEYVAADSTLSASVDAHLDANISALSASAHAARAGGATSASAHSQRVAMINTLSGSAHTQRDALNTAQTTANNTLSSSIATALRAEYVAADTALSGAQKTYIDAKVAGIVSSAPETLDTLDELAAALNDDPNFSASIATSIGNRVLTSTFNTYSGSAAGALRTEYVAGDAALSASAHTQREAIKGLATTANNSLSSSIATALRAEYVAGDSAYKDEDGCHWIMGRIDDVLNVSGHRLGTMEVESALVANEMVAEAAVVGRPHEVKGESIFAFVVTKGERPSGKGAKKMQEALRKWVAEQVGAIAKPDEIRFSDNLPKTRSGKIMRRLLRAIARDEAITQDISTLEDESIIKQLQGED